MRRKNVKVTHSAFRGLAAPWTGRAHMKYRGTASYQIVFRNNQPVNENIEFANCEFTDDHDFAFMRFVKNLQFHHNFVDNFNDDGLECGPKLRDHSHVHLSESHRRAASARSRSMRSAKTNRPSITIRRPGRTSIAT